MPKYTFTGKIDLTRTLIAMVVAVLGGFAIGCSYGFLMDLNPFIILDFVILVLLVFGTIGLCFGLVQLGKVRNKLIKIVLGLIVAVVSFYVAWAYAVFPNLFAELFDVAEWLEEVTDYMEDNAFSIGKMTSSSSLLIDGVLLQIFYFIELLVFMIPVFAFLFGSRQYYCESCERFNVNQNLYLVGSISDGTIDKIDYSGDMTSLKELIRFKETVPFSAIIQPNEQVHFAEVSYCKNCQQNGVLNFSSGSLTRDEKKAQYTFTKSKKLLADTLISPESVGIFSK